MYLVVVIAIGLLVGRKDRDSKDFFLGGRQIPWWAVLGSLVATEVSAATFLAVPGVGFSENFNYLQFGVGSLLARFFVAFVFISVFYKLGCVTIYEFLGKRFGPRSQKVGSVLFLITRLMASGVRLLIAASGLSIILGVPLSLSIPAFCVLAVIYTGAGGIRAVVWTDCIQAIIFISAGICALFYLGNSLGWDVLIDVSQNAGRLEVFRFEPEQPGLAAWFSDGNVFWLAVVFGFVQTTAALGTDHDLTQRLLTTKNSSQARLSLILSGFIALPIAGLFLCVGAALFVLAQAGEADVLLSLTRSDDAFPTFIAQIAPVGLKGLLIAGVLAAAMSSLDSAMAALSSSATNDLLRPLRERWFKAYSLMNISRVATVIFSIILGSIAFVLHQTGGQYLWLAFQLSSITYGALLGIFLLGFLNKERGNDASVLIAVICSVLTTLALLTMIKLKVIGLGWTWLIVIGTCLSFLVAYCLGSKERGEA